MALFLKTFLIISLIIFTCLFIFSLVIFAVHHITGGAMFVPSARPVMHTVLDKVDFAGFSHVVELGTGDGRFMRAVERKYGVPVRGYEINPLAWLITRLGCVGRRSSVRWKNFWKTDLGDADCVFCYLFPDVIPRLRDKFEAELAPGTQVISANFPIPGWHEERVLKTEAKVFNDPVYVYVMGRQRPRE